MLRHFSGRTFLINEHGHLTIRHSLNLINYIYILWYDTNLKHNTIIYL